MIPEDKHQQTDRAHSRGRSFARFLKEPLSLKDLLLALLVGFLILFLFQASYVWQHLKFLANVQASGSAEDLIEEIQLGSNTVHIPRIGVTAPLVYIESNKEADIQRALQRGVVHYAGTALPGAFGNAYFTGHSSDLPWKRGGYKTIFALLPYLEANDLVYVTTDDALLTYRVVETKVVRPNDLSVLDQRNNERQFLTLQTSYPVGTAFRRYIVVAELEAEDS